MAEPLCSKSRPAACRLTVRRWLPGWHLPPPASELTMNTNCTHRVTLCDSNYGEHDISFAPLVAIGHADGSVTVPAALRPYMGGLEKITRP